MAPVLSAHANSISSFPNHPIPPLTEFVRRYQDACILPNFLFSLTLSLSSSLSPTLPTLLRKIKHFISLFSKSQWPHSPIPCHPSSQGHITLSPTPRPVWLLEGETFIGKMTKACIYYFKLVLPSHTFASGNYAILKSADGETIPYTAPGLCHLYWSCLDENCQDETAPFLHIKQEEMAESTRGEDESWY